LTNWFYPKGSLQQDGWDVVVGKDTPGWKYTGTKVGDFKKKEVFALDADDWERAIWALDGDGITVAYQGAESGSKNLRGRKSVFHGPADFIFLPRNTSAKITGSGRFIVAEALAKGDSRVQFKPKEDVSVLLRGAGPSTRQIHDYGGVDEIDASAMVVVEVLVPSGNHSGIPPHKHDTFIPGVESNLEEVYYFELAPGRQFKTPAQSDPVAYFRTYASDDRPINLELEVRDGDVALVPYGYHGPASAVPPYDLYFMNVMAGPDPDRAWNIVDDPNHSWARSTWDGMDKDPRLPYLAD
jgi:5-deoxy-glucuronate isomerase